VTATLQGICRVEQIMGMPIVVDVRDAEVAEEALDEVFAWLREVDGRFSTYLETSEIRRIDRGELSVADAHPDVRWILGRCDELRIETHGFFDARYGDSLDPSGLVKGWAVDRASALLSRRGYESHGVSAGGDMRLVGGALPDEVWRVGIQHPLARGEVAAIVEARDLALATSGAYARGEHVVDPHWGSAPSGVLSVTVTGPELATADAYATAAFAMGKDALHFTARLPEGFEALTILADERVLTTPGFPSV
jgi:thiamine biosynthesis lipoprotein